tara:strand:+ start:21 stop:452 length:432 start_codon:yes stop_codon:yes gene_type:complete
MTDQAKVPIWFWIVSVLALLWNGAGVAAFIDQLTLTTADLAQMPETKRAVFSGPPLWTMIAFGLAVLAGFLGSIFLLLRKKIAVSLFILSLAAVVVQLTSYFIVDGYLEYLNDQGWTMTVLIVVVAIALIWYSRSMARRGILR